MTPAARAAAAIELLDAFARPGETAAADALMARWAKANRYAGAKDRAAIADLVYGALRRFRSAAEPLGPTGRGRLLSSFVAEGRALETLDALFCGGRFGPTPLSEDERAALRAWRPQAAPPDWPDWLAAELAASVADPAAEARAQTRRAPVDLRVNALKATREAAAARLAAEGVEVAPAPVSPLGLRLKAPARVDRSETFAAGWVEVQEAASQAAALLAAALIPETPRPIALDLCAGAGGKTLALAASLPRAARLCAYDVAPQRLADLPERAARAGARPTLLDDRARAALDGACALVLVDAPCSGSGTWSRRPDAKWRLAPDRLDAQRDAQDQALALGARATAPGGVLVYATCSLLGMENEGARARFLASHPAFAPIAIGPAWARAGLSGAPTSRTESRFSPATTDTDGFYVAAFERAGSGGT